MLVKKVNIYRPKARRDTQFPHKVAPVISVQILKPENSAYPLHLELLGLSSKMTAGLLFCNAKDI